MKIGDYTFHPACLLFPQLPDDELRAWPRTFVSTACSTRSSRLTARSWMAATATWPAASQEWSPGLWHGAPMVPRPSGSSPKISSVVI